MLFVMDLTRERILATIILPCTLFSPPPLPVVLTLMRSSPDSAAESCCQRAQEKKRKKKKRFCCTASCNFCTAESYRERLCTELPVVLAHERQRVGLASSSRLRRKQLQTFSSRTFTTNRVFSVKFTSSGNLALDLTAKKTTKKQKTNKKKTKEKKAG